MTKFNINKLEFNSITNEYGYVEFNDIKLYVTKDKQWFCVTRFIREIKKHLESYKKFNGSLGHRCSTRIINRFKEHYPQLFLPYVQGPCKGKVSGQYVSFELFEPIVYSIEPIRGTAWLRNEPWQDKDMKGYIYLLQPPKMIGTNVFKIGETKDMNQRLNNNEYGKGTMVLGIVSVNNRSKAEGLMKQWFSNHGALLVQGNEYFEVSDMNEAYDLFTDANLKDTNEDDAILFEPGEWIHGETFPDELEEQETAPTVAEFVREKFDDINRFYLSDVKESYKKLYNITKTFDELKKEIEETGEYKVTNCSRTYMVSKL